MRRTSTLSALSALAIVLLLVALAQPAAAHVAVPDGKIAYVTVANGHREISSIDVIHTNDVRTLVDLGDRDASEPAWTNDGTGLAFTAETSPGGATAIYTSAADGSGIRQVTFPPDGSADSHPSWSPGAGAIVFARSTPDSVSGILIVDVNTLDVRPLDVSTLPTTVEPDWSPDGGRIAFAGRKVTDPATCDASPSSCTWGVFVANADGTGEPRQLAYDGINLRDPDWSPDGTQIAATFSFMNDTTYYPAILDAATGSIIRQFSTSGLSKPSWSPYGNQLAVQLGGVVLIYDSDGNSVRFLVGGTDPAWGLVQDGTPPVLTLTVQPGSDGWFTTPASVGLTAVDDRRIVPESMMCTLAGFPAVIFSTSAIPGGFAARVDLAREGEGLPLSCSAEDASGNVGSASATVNVRFPPPPDRTPPVVSPVSIDPNPIRAGQAATVSVTASDADSGIDQGFVLIGGRTIPMGQSGSILSANVGSDLGAGFYEARVQVLDRARNATLAPSATLMVYDPAAGSVGGTGWIVPSTSAGDVLPVSIDGTTKGSFSFSAKYKSDAATTPTGFLKFSYGSQFKLDSESLDWLVVTPGEWAYIQGTASIRGMNGPFRFRLSVRDGSPDFLELDIWTMAMRPGVDAPLYRTSGVAGGQIQIQR